MRSDTRDFIVRLHDLHAKRLITTAGAERMLRAFLLGNPDPSIVDPYAAWRAPDED